MKRALLAPMAALSLMLLSGCVSSDSESAGTDGATRGGKTGSMARFQVVGDRLYALSGNQLQVYSVGDPAAMAFQNAVDVGFGIETLFARGGMLYVGSTTGMHLYDASSPDDPVKTAEITHMRSCDPVVVEGATAYLTLRTGGNNCWNGANELQIIDVENPFAPRKLKTFPMANPHGLGIDGDLLFICDGYAGLKVYKLGDDLSLTLADKVSGLEAYDVIPDAGREDHLIMISKDGLYQYDYSQMPMKRLSVIRIGT